MTIRINEHTEYSDYNSRLPAKIIRTTFILICALSCFVFPKNDSFVGINKFSIDPDASEYYKSIDILLFQRLNFELLPRGIRPFLIDDSISREYIATISGSIESVNDEAILYFKISVSSQSEEEIKKVSLQNQPIDAIIDILAIKVRHFLEQNVSGKLRITTTPLDCDIFLNGIKIGKTPAELILEQGNYSIQLQKEYLFPHFDSVTVLPGQETLLSTTMQFRGHTLKPWIITALLLSGCTILSQVAEYHFYEEYNNLRPGPEADRNLFNKKFNRYKITNGIKITFLIPTATAWTMAGYHFIENKSLKKRVLSIQK